MRQQLLQLRSRLQPTTPACSLHRRCWILCRLQQQSRACRQCLLHPVLAQLLRQLPLQRQPPQLLLPCLLRQHWTQLPSQGL
jgi:hypothetical protein